MSKKQLFDEVRVPVELPKHTDLEPLLSQLSYISTLCYLLQQKPLQLNKLPIISSPEWKNGHCIIRLFHKARGNAINKNSIFEASIKDA